jgi:hypothetical protein
MDQAALEHMGKDKPPVSDGRPAPKREIAVDDVDGLKAMLGRLGR